jgi:uncharacterized membrane protein YdjX (TVP38/TMEM64 family)
MLSYVGLMIVAVIVAPFDTLPLLPVAVQLWGPLFTAFLSIAGWSLGALFAFLLARRWGPSLACRFVRKCDIEEWGTVLPKKNIFWLIVLFRLVLPVDIISYAAGIFTKMDWTLYLAATVVGVAPFAFLFSYGAQLPVIVQAVAGFIIVVVLASSYSSIKLRLKKWSKKSF